MRITADGRITIPEHLRERYGLTPGTDVQFETAGDALLIRRAEPSEGAAGPPPPAPAEPREDRPAVPLSTAPYPGKGAALVALTLAQRTAGLTPEQIEEIFREED